MKDILTHIQGMPKAELHVHLEGVIAPDAVMLLAERNKIELPYKSSDALAQSLADLLTGKFAVRDFADITVKND